MNPAPDKILFFSHQDELPADIESDTKTDHWRAYFPTHQVDVSADAKFAIDSLRQHLYDVIILDDELFGDAIYVAIRQLKQMKLLIPILVLTADDSLTYQTNLMEAGAEDILLTTQPPEYLQRRLNLCLKRNEYNRAVIQRNQKLYEITQLTQYLHTNVEPQTLIEETIRVVCGTFDLYGAAAVLLERGNLRVYSSQESVPEREMTVVQTLRDADPNAPFTRVLRTGVTEVFDDIARDKYYLPLPYLARARSAIAMPLRYHSEIVGALVLFGSAETPIDADDLGLYEIVTTQFALALQNAYFNRMQQANIQNGRILLNAWQTFLRVQSAGEVAESLAQNVEQLASVDQVMVWINNDEEARSAAVYAGSAQAKATFSDVFAKGTIAGLIEGINEGPQVVLPLGLPLDDPMLPLFRALRARQLIFMPLADSARLIGGVLVSMSSDQQMSLEAANILKSLAHAAGQALERMMLIEAMTEKSDRLEATLRTITEGTFFVDDSGRIAYCNPQLSELTGINPSEMLGQRPEVLLNLLAEQAVSEDKARLQFYNAVSSLQSISAAERNYPIVDLTLKKTGQQIHVEFVAMGRQASGNWIGLVWTNARGSRETPSESVDLLLHTLHATGSQLRALVGRFMDAHSPVEQQRLLGDIERGSMGFEQLLEQYARLYNLNFSEAVWNAEVIELGQLVEDLVRNYEQSSHDMAHIIFDTQFPDDLFYIEMDRKYAEKGLFHLLDSLIHRMPRDGRRKITTRLEDHGDDVHLVIAAPVLNPQDALPLDDPDNAMWAEISAMNRIRYRLDIQADNMLLVTVAFPKRQIAQLRAITLEAEVGAPVRTPEAVMVIRGRSAITETLITLLERENLHLFMYESGEDAVQDVTLTRLDLIVVDGSLPYENSLEICKQLRRRTEVPVVMVATRATNLERVEALRAGVDDYITEPISNEELLAKISVLFKRQHLADRTEAPLDLGDLRIDFSRRAVFVNHKPVLLTRIEYDLLRTLAVNMGQVLTHQQLLEKVWGPEYRSETQYLWVNISRLRKKLEPTAYILNQQGIGYVFQTV